jgi:hypothetical protein
MHANRAYDAYKMHAYEMAYGRCTLTTPAYNAYEMHANHACEMHAWEMHTYEIHAYKVPICGRTTPVRDTLGRCTPMRCPSMGDARL